MLKIYLLLSVFFLTFLSCGDMQSDLIDLDTLVTLWGVEYSVKNTTRLDLSYSGLTGSIPPEIANLNNLTRLDLRGNQLSGSLPSEMGYMTKLKYLDLRDNQLSGAIPQSFCNLLPNLEWRDIIMGGVHFYSSMNQLCPPYPSCIDPYVGEQNLCPCGFEDDSMVSLWGYCYPIESTTEIKLYNRGLSGYIPPEIGNLINLTSLDLSENQLTGSIPPEIGNLINLTELDLGSNQLTDSIPPEIGNLINLTELALGSNQLTGSIPPEIGNLINLAGRESGIGNFISFYPGLDLSENQLTGSIPPEIGDLINLKYLYLGGNQLTGSIPPEIGYLPNLVALRLNHNQLSGLVPESICWPNLTWYNCNSIRMTPTSSINSNQLCPPYPSCLSGTYNCVFGEYTIVDEQDISDCN